MNTIISARKAVRVVRICAKALVLMLNVAYMVALPFVFFLVENSDSILRQAFFFSPGFLTVLNSLLAHRMVFHYPRITIGEPDDTLDTFLALCNLIVLPELGLLAFIQNPSIILY